MKAEVWVRKGANVRNLFWRSKKMEGPSLREVKKELRQRVKAKLSKVAPEEVANQCMGASLSCQHVLISCQLLR